MAQLGGSASTEVDASIEECWALAIDVEKAPEWQDGMKTMVVKDRDAQGRAKAAETSADAKVRVVTTQVAFTYDEPRRMAWSQTKGDLKKLDGMWEFEDLGGGRTKVTYTLDGDPGRVLGMLIRGPVEGKIRDLMVNGRPGEFKARIEAQ